MEFVLPTWAYSLAAKPIVDFSVGVYKKGKTADRVIDRIFKEYRETAEDKEDAERIKRALLKWRSSRSFRKLLKAAHVTTDTTRLAESANNSFVEVTGLSYKVSHVRTPELIDIFVDYLLAELRAQDPVHAQISIDKRFNSLSYQVSQSNVLGQNQDALSARFRIAPIDNIENRDKSEFQLHARIDTCKKHIEKRQVSLAKNELTALRNFVLKNCSKNLRFRIATNLGVCHLNLGEFESADQEFRSALMLFPENHLALANCANSAIFADDWAVALTMGKKSVELESSTPFSMCIYLMALHGNDLKVEIAQLRLDKPWIESDPLCLMALGQNAYDDKDFPLAEEFYKRALELNPYDVQLHLLLAQSICRQVHIQLMANLPAMHRIPPEIEQRIILAKGEIEHALSLCKDDDNDASRNRVFIVRAAVRAMSNEVIGAHEDCDLVLSSDPDNPTALANKASLLVSEGHYPDAKVLLDKLPERMRLQTGALKGTVFVNLKLYAEGIEAFLEYLESADVSDTMRLAAVAGLIDAHDRNREPEEATKVIEEYSSEYSGNAEFTYAKSLHEKLNNNRDGYMDLLRAAVNEAHGQLADFLNRELARAYSDDGDSLFARDREAAVTRYKMSVEVYERFVCKNTDTQETREYLIALANADRMSDAYELAKMIRDNGPAIEVITDVESRYLEDHYAWEDAENLLKQLVTKFPEREDFRKRLEVASRFVKLTIKKSE